MNKIASSGSHPKKEIIVSVRLPKSLIDELKEIQKINHFMDLSDEIRFVVRRYCLNFMNIGGKENTQAILEQRRKEKLIEDLTKIIENLRGKEQKDAKVQMTDEVQRNPSG